MLVLGGAVIMATLVALIMWRADRDARKRKNVSEARSKVASGDSVKARQVKDVASPVKRGKAKAS